MFTIVHLTLVEARRRRIVVAAFLVGCAFLLVFGTGMYFIARTLERQQVPLPLRQGNLALLTTAACYAANFLVALFAILLPVDALSGEIDSGVIQTIAAKPIGRSSIVLGKWLGHWMVIAVYLLAVIGGVFVVSRAVSGYTPEDLVRILLLMLLEVTLLLSVSVAGGTRLSTVTNGVMACGFYGVAFMGGWIEQIGALAGIQSARNIGIAVSLVSPADALWRLGSYYMQPTLVRDAIQGSPFATASVPNALMVWWAGGMTLVVIAIGVRAFSRRPL
jgi:ABC-type transport system involved in multi-copper enzyme maturation permease subunit